MNPWNGGLPRQNGAAGLANVIYVVDNGQSCSDHSIYFYEFDDKYPVEEIKWLLHNLPGYESYEVLAVTRKLEECFNGFEPLKGFEQDAHRIFERREDDEWIKRCPKELLLDAFTDWYETLQITITRADGRWRDNLQSTIARIRTRIDKLTEEMEARL